MSQLQWVLCICNGTYRVRDVGQNWHKIEGEIGRKDPDRTLILSLQHSSLHTVICMTNNSTKSGYMRMETIETGQILQCWPMIDQWPALATTQHNHGHFRYTPGKMYVLSKTCKILRSSSVKFWKGLIYQM